MITYLYWAATIALAMAVLALLGRSNRWKYGFIGAAIVFVLGWGLYYFHFQQVFVKRYGGVMSVTVPEGQQHITATWKDDNLWIENYDPAANTCHFNEYSKGNLLQGKVVIKNCNPLRGSSVPPGSPRPAAPANDKLFD
ncbi:MAG TPA: hypothetical protein VL027_07395 [Spongiibacteraceae bacterium]|jgi:hypothetical protein|nr:hypothetical protein [Spongiibacteraceae bacterium]HUH37752.1 hypothetical protein [Spongiibacteraceae bacterium]